MNDWEMRGKESSPEKTIAKIEGILSSYGFEAQLKEVPHDLPDCYSCRLTIKGPTGVLMGTNGKGMTKELSHASAYGEMMERMENRVFAAMPRFDDEHYEDFMLPNNPLYDLRSPDQPRCIVELKKRLAATVKGPLIMKTPEEVVDSIIEKLSPVALKGRFPTLPFYSLTEKRVVNLPNWMLIFTGSNGLAAGNTLPEAMVEGISELLERYSQIRLLDGDIIPPRIPDEVIDRYPHIRRIINSIEKADNGRYSVRVLDASLGKGVPTICGVVIDTKTGKFGVKFGAQPNMAIALERVFTESMQGSTLKQFTNNSYPNFTAATKQVRVDKWNSVKITSSSMPAQFLMDEPTYPFVEWESVEGKSNHELMMSMLNKMRELGADIYVRDASYMGFPAVFIYATGISEVRPVDLLELKINALWMDVQRYFLHIGDLTDDEVRDIAIFAASKRGSVLENTIGAISQLYFADDMPGAPFEADFLLAACQYRLGQTEQAANTLHELMMILSVVPERQFFIKACYYYVSARVSSTEEQAYDVIKQMTPSVAERVRYMFIDPKQTLGRIYPDCKGKACNDVTEGSCQYAAVHDFYKKLFAAEAAHPVDTSIVAEMLRDF